MNFAQEKELRELTGTILMTGEEYVNVTKGSRKSTWKIGDNATYVPLSEVASIRAYSKSKSR